MTKPTIKPPTANPPAAAPGPARSGAIAGGSDHQPCGLAEIRQAEIAGVLRDGPQVRAVRASRRG